MGSKAVVRPPRLGPGCRVALVAPAGPLGERDDLSRAIELCQALGYVPAPGEHVLERYGYLAGSDDLRAGDLNTALEDPTIDAVWCLRGGYGVTRLLDRLNLEALARWPKPVIGFSDITALLLAIRARTGLVSFHGPMSRAPLTSFSRGHFEQVLGRAEPAGVLAGLTPPAGLLVPRSPRVVALHGGRAEGPLVGGNLTLLLSLAGTPYFPDLDGALLFLEDVGEDLYRVDRHLSQLKLMGVLPKVAGVVVGQFTDMKKGTGDGGALAFDEVLFSYLAPLGIPVAYGFPFGHVDDQWTLPLGVRARLDADAGSLALLEPAVS